MSKEFRQKLIEKLEDKLGDWQSYSIPELMARSELKGLISDETLRRVLAGKPVRFNTQNLILSAFEESIEKTEFSQLTHGIETAKVVENLLTKNERLFSIRSKKAQIDLTLNFTDTVLRIKCIDDDKDVAEIKKVLGASKEVPDKYFTKHISNALQDLRDERCSSYIILSHLNPRPALVNSLRSSKIKFEPQIKLFTLHEFLQTFFDTKNYLHSLHRKLLKHGLVLENDKKTLDHESLLNIPVRYNLATVPSEDSNENTFIRDEIKSFIKEDDRLLVILGHHGAGKSLSCLISAFELINEDHDNNRIFPLPIVVQATSFLSLQPSAVIGRVHEEIEIQYRASLPRNLIETLVNEGKIVVFIDGIDESRSSGEWSTIKKFFTDLLDNHKYSDRPKYIITARHELFETEEIESRTFSSLQLVKVLSLAACTLDETYRILRNRFSSFDDLKQDNAFGKLIKLTTNPLSLELAIGVLTMMQNPSRKGGGSSQNMAVAREAYDLFSEYTRAWAKREQLRAVSTEITPSLSERLKFCELLAEVAWDNAYSEGIDSEALKFATIEQYKKTGLNITNNPSELEFLFYDAKISSCLIRRNDNFDFPDPRLHSFYLSKRIVSELIDRRSRFTVLRKKRIEQDEFEGLSTFVLGGLNADHFNRIDDILDLLTDLINDSRSFNHCQSFQELSNLHFNLIGLLCWVSIKNSGKHKPLRLQKVYCPYGSVPSFGLEPEILKKLPITVERGNCEFNDLAIFNQSGNGQLLTKKPDALSESQGYLSKTKSIENLQEYCWSNNILERDSNRDVNSQNDLKWVIIPGGKYSLNQWEANDKQEYEDNWWSDTKRRGIKSKLTKGKVDVLTESFLLSQHPVTNGQFLEFILKEHEWSPQNHRDAIGNRWYLLGFNWLIQKYSDDLSRWSVAEIREYDPIWFDSPVVSVTWSAANAFATYHGSYLPLESQIEIAMNLFDYPEDKGLKKDKWYIYFDKEGGKNNETMMIPSYVPRFDCTKANPFSPDQGVHFDLSSFESEMKKLDPSLINIPYHLAGGVSEWTSCQWDPHWPINSNHYGMYKDTIIAPYNNGLGLINQKPKRILSAEDNIEKGYSQRGGSYVTTLDQHGIYHRSVQPVSNANEDVGFRLAKPIY
ncbi:hypothetical protein BFP97_17825 [Roseivirga sp. 4D4]|uniref:SUMF1/EgtB/PvdO family nonheme iron enzyme n=1 Tax=Roseivirga sp. 4D4 TaxID=1889784 RepID=UPI00085316F7|nr:SUMF1/EgtB/PvdO family nonheme iron enzyme [Roseivirga sp. 4D4]OEK03269.1 hypothetical protein BFP97_17825 [Roseivirga sp. 4D4]